MRSTTHLSKYIITSKTLTAEVSFVDVPEDAWYMNELAWAAGKGIAKGTDAAGTIFEPETVCSRAQAVTMMYRADGQPDAGVSGKFTDVDEELYGYAVNAINWAVAMKIATGATDTTFEPASPCVRAQMVVFLYRMFNGVG